ncbi:cytochrome-c oxidase, cbb3-type subunit III [Rhodovarius crocodyli]|uniref:Cbb3-type cytochrome c oxidase subunit n=1 Tax=Rhodovarius crocodyli TaxID=1979269 RepID=A0A437MEQ3_9PROT|nr:cytochrome-c oxidase, cbb3-type subunit III [Rhodovarius crocodyli]RVT96102.1 cytochrome-c oxidase, cbb3-type subunit III [Rhodovarius crocodyli]
MPTKIEKDAISGTDTTGHEWDGLKELNTPLPRWWLYTFYATIVFAAVWVVLYPAIPIRGLTGVLGYTAREAGTAELAEARTRAEPMMARLRAATPAQIAADPDLRAYAIAGGRVAFANNCAACHGAGGQGATGGYPTLADDDWLWGGTLDAIRTTITHGIRSPDDEEARTSVMPRFLGDGMLTRPQIHDVAQHVLGLSGLATDQAAAQRGAAVFAENCVSCHGDQGEGNAELGAARLNDRIWLNGPDTRAIEAFIANPRLGVMPAFGQRLDAATINMLAVYVHSLGGGR